MGSALWCATCGSVHEEPAACPGNLRATGPERHGWRVTVETPFGLEAYGVLVAPASALWRARILTFPNILWTIPGGASTLKFVAGTPQDAEAQAIAFIESHIRSRGFARRDLVDATAPGRYRAEAHPEALAPAAARRKEISVPIRFGSGTAQFTALTGNLSESGMFVVTLSPLDPGTSLRLLMSLATGPLPMKGEVVWSRPHVSPGRPMGMGLRLVSPPLLYQEYVREV